MVTAEARCRPLTVCSRRIPAQHCPNGCPVVRSISEGIFEWHCCSRSAADQEFPCHVPLFCRQHVCCNIDFLTKHQTYPVIPQLMFSPCCMWGGKKLARKATMNCGALVVQVPCNAGAALARPAPHNLRTADGDVALSNPVLRRKGCGTPARGNMRQDDLACAPVQQGNCHRTWPAFLILSFSLIAMWCGNS
jgi:hypothetical protein